jgi:hypothetical protein
VGRQEPSLHGRFDKDGAYHPGIEDMARAVFGDEDEPLALMTPEEWHGAGELRGCRRRDGSRRGAKVRVHRDRRVQEVVEQIREQETMQALSRLRLVHRAVPAEVFILSNVVLPVTVDRLVTWKELVPSRLEVAAARLDGVLPLAPARLAGRFPDLWATAKAAELEVARVVKTPQAPIKVLLLEDEEFSAATYRRVGQRGRASQALIRADHPDPEAALEKLVGPLAMFRWEREPPPDDFTDPRTWDLDEPRPADVVPLMDTCSRCGDPTAPGVAVCSVCEWLEERTPKP